MVNTTSSSSSSALNSVAIIATGSSGLLASALKHYCQDKHISFYGIDVNGEAQSTNILEPEILWQRLRQIQDECSTNGESPVLFHFAAITITGSNLTPEQKDLTWKLNVEGTRNVLDGCIKTEIPMVHISTDFVFSGGTKYNPYLPSDTIAPDATEYSQSKAEAEKVVLAKQKDTCTVILRPAYPYGNPSHPKPDLVRKMLNWMDTNEQVKLYEDQHISPSPVPYFIEGCLRIAGGISSKTIHTGSIFHLAGKPVTPYEFGNLVKKVFKKTAVLVPTQIGNQGASYLVLDRSDTEAVLGITAPEHEEVLTLLSKANLTY